MDDVWKNGRGTKKSNGPKSSNTSYTSYMSNSSGAAGAPPPPAAPPEDVCSRAMMRSSSSWKLVEDELVNKSRTWQTTEISIYSTKCYKLPETWGKCKS
jgi:hypothetical protein